MSALWSRLNQRYAQMVRRERMLVALACVSVTLMLGYAYAIDPLQMNRDKALRQIALYDEEARRIGEQAAQLTSQATHPERAAQAAMARIDAEGVTLRARMRELDQRLVSPADMDRVLAELLHRRPGIRVLSLNTLPARPLAETEAEDAPAKAAPEGLYRHTLLVEVEGSYADLTALLEQLDIEPSRLFREKVRLTSQGRGRCRLALELFTLGMEQSWLAL